MPAPSKLLWRCRRGMREMDILCSRFVESVYDQLSEHERGVLERLLECPDQDILGWLTSSNNPEDGDLAAMVRRMRAISGGTPGA